MREYFAGVSGLCLLGSVFLQLIHGERTEGATRVAFSLILIGFLVAPIGRAVRDLPDQLPPVFEDATDRMPMYERVGQDAFERGVSRAVAERFSLSEQEILVVAEGWDAQTMRASRVRITLTGRSVLADSRAVRDYVERSGLGACEVNIEIG